MLADTKFSCQKLPEVTRIPEGEFPLREKTLFYSSGDWGATWAYTYDADGMRTSRSDGSKTYRYVYNGGKLRQMTVGDDTLQFMYDANGVPMSMLHNGTLYYYVTNIQGDVVAILNTTGTAVVAYSYDAYHNIKTVNNNSGFLAVVTDSATGRKTTYYYDLTDWLVNLWEPKKLYSCRESKT